MPKLRLLLVLVLAVAAAVRAAPLTPQTVTDWTLSDSSWSFDSVCTVADTPLRFVPEEFEVCYAYKSFPNIDFSTHGLRVELEYDFFDEFGYEDVLGSQWAGYGGEGFVLVLQTVSSSLANSAGSRLGIHETDGDFTNTQLLILEVDVLDASRVDGASSPLVGDGRGSFQLTLQRGSDPGTPVASVSAPPELFHTSSGTHKYEMIWRPPSHITVAVDDVVYIDDNTVDVVAELGGQPILDSLMYVGVVTGTGAIGSSIDFNYMKFEPAPSAEEDDDDDGTGGNKGLLLNPLVLGVIIAGSVGVLGAAAVTAVMVRKRGSSEGSSAASALSATTKPAAVIKAPAVALTGTRTSRSASTPSATNHRTSTKSKSSSKGAGSGAQLQSRRKSSSSQSRASRSRSAGRSRNSTARASAALSSRGAGGLQGKEAGIMLVSALLDPEMSLVRSFLDGVKGVVVTSKVCSAIIDIFIANDHALPLLKAIIGRELVASTEHSDLFRANSSATKLFSAYARRVGTPFLNKAVKPVLDAIADNKQGIEIDASRTKADVATQVQQLQAVCTQLLDGLTQHAKRLPDEFRLLGHYMVSQVGQKYPGKETSTLAGFLFLRFITPALNDPAAYEVKAASLNDVQKRSVLLVSKVLQALAQGTDLGAKEAYMSAMNPWLSENQEQMQALIKGVSTASRQSMLSISLPSFESRESVMFTSSLTSEASIVSTQSTDYLLEVMKDNPGIVRGLRSHDADASVRASVRQSMAMYK